MKGKFIALVLFSCLLISPQLFSATTGKIVGVVTDKNTAEPLIGVNVIVEETTLGSTTDLDGSYLILNVPPGTYTLSFQYIGYREVKISGVKVSVDFTTKVNAEMQEATVDLGETVEVVAEREVIRKDLTSSQSEVTAEDIENIPTEEFEDVLQLQAGVTRDDQGGFHIRGGRSSEVAFWVDGVSVTDAFDGSVGVEIENDAVKSLQVISGTFNAEYGQAMSGIVNIVTKSGGREYSGSVSAYTGDYLTPDGTDRVGLTDDSLFLNIDDVSPRHIYNYKFSLSGPIPLLGKKNTFFVNFRNFYNQGYLYGRRDVFTDGSPGDSAFVSMNSNEWFTGQSKLSFQLTDLLKVNATFNYENREFREYDHFYKFNPEGDFDKFQWGYNSQLTIDHTLSKTTFYTVKFARFEKNFEQYVYENPEDPRYVDNLDPKFTTSAFQFSIGGQKNQHFSRTTATNIVKLDITSQVTKRHLMKMGVEGRLNNLDLEDFSIIDGSQFTQDTTFFPVKPDPTSINFSQYSFEPIELSAYIQDKIEYENFIVNVGVRFDYFDSQGQILSDPMDPSIDAPLLPVHQEMSRAEREEIWYDEPSAKYQFSPRIGLAYPISANGVIHASYGHFLQIPEFRLLYENPSFKITADNNNLFGNADLDAQRTIMYEIGLQQQITSDIGVDVTGFFRDVRNWVGTSPLQETYRTDIFYSQYENRDYANIRGVTITVDKQFSNHFAGNLSYTGQVAEGNASDPADAFNDEKANREPRKELIPLDWDRTHVLSGNIYLGFGDYSLSFLGRYETGLPYTPNIIQGTRRGANIQSGLEENSERRPALITFDLQLYKNFYINIGGKETKLQLFARVFNLFDRRNEQNVWADTGSADFTLETGISGENADRRWASRPDFYSEPRRVQFGLSYDF